MMKKQIGNRLSNSKRIKPRTLKNLLTDLSGRTDELVIVIITFISLIFALTMFMRSKELISHFDKGVFRTTYQFFLIIVTGAGVSWLYKELTRIQEARERARQELIQLHSNLVKNYNSYKRIKRLLRALALRNISKDGSEQQVLLVSQYVPLLKNLNDVQLTFEAHKRALIEANLLIQKEEAAQITEALKKIETYLNKVVKEFESSLQNDADREVVELSNNYNLCYTKEFIGPRSESSKEREDALKGFDDAINLLSTNLYYERRTLAQLSLDVIKKVLNDF